MIHNNTTTLYALVVAYKNGLINITPLDKWVNKERRINYIIKQLIFIVVFLYGLILINEGSVLDLERTLTVNKTQIADYKMWTIMFVVPLIISVTKLIRYLYHVIYVHKQLKNYCFVPTDINALKQISFKVKR